MKQSNVVSPGRPRSVEAEQAILNATWKLLIEGTVRDLSIEAIARAAGVGKTTIYRWWQSKTAVVIDAFLAKVTNEIPFPDKSSATEALTEQVISLVKAYSGDYGRIVAEIIAEGQGDKEALENFRQRFLLPRRLAARAVIEKGIQSGEFDPNLDAELAMDILYGPIYYRLLIAHLPLNEEFALSLLERALRCFLKKR
ncbi:TetR/AcrR family transcriptional regulator [Iningainema tapete]|uniref:TetR/AcrR family transcriptional regulator n=1 Tax=Iningainema tapete BLCC-T55 TaxID=2748662 RepID=A0A8J7C587_9CYAN|nr:TetR/AcrR family transcriptional regulator [Iningainema tapete]MBD2772739.1 TetR/AcrR family transcriptional regulator [Iningainema tapete BLCC-T55]